MKILETHRTQRLMGKAAALFTFFLPSSLPASVDSTAPFPITHSLSRPTSLSKEEATQRTKQISQISYTLWLGIEPERSQFDARVVIRFDLKQKAKDHGSSVFLDLEEGTLRSILVNGSPLTDLSRKDRFDGHHIYFKLSELKPTANRIEISYTHPFSTNGNGLHRFKDPVDNKVYLYSDFEPYHAHRLFPCFDQPDLKASYELTVEAPNDWTVISNTLERETNNVDGRKSWAFPPSAVLSPYVFAVHAGPYASWKSTAQGIPLRLFSRQSLAKYIDFKEWFEITKQGLDFYGTQFGFPYPFPKYDQIIVPDFNAGAMENAGAVTFSEKFIFRTRTTQDHHRRRADTILHEMAHMWFGDLVTMRWWNGLWLNESFATFMAATAVDQATEFKESWQSFFSSVKQWAYWEDQLTTNHPIELPVADTEQAEANFDGITYGKGASSLKQLRFYLGEEDFREGLQRYFQKYAFRNTSIGDFIKMLSEASSQDLSKWQQLWLQTPGLNTAQATWECTAESTPDNSKKSKTLKNSLKISKFEIIQGGEILRPHRTQVALYQFTKNRNPSTAALNVTQKLNVTYSEAKTPLKEAIGLPCPDLVFPNFEDQDYVKIELDPSSLKRIELHLAQMNEPFSRQMLWHTLWEMVIDGKYRPQDYADLVLLHGNHEKNTQILSKILPTLTAPTLNRSSVVKFLTGELRLEYQGKIEAFIRRHLISAPPGSDLQLIWYQAFLDAANCSAASHEVIQSVPQSSCHFAKALLEKKSKLKGFDLDQEHRWELIQVLARNGYPGAQGWIEAELKNDLTDMGQKAAIAAEVSIPDPELKDFWLKRLTSASPNLSITSPAKSVTHSLFASKTLSLSQLREAMWNYPLLGQEKLIQSSTRAYFDTLSKIALSSSIEDEHYSKVFVKAMFPALCDPEVIRQTTSLLNTHSDLPASVTKTLKVNRQEEERCIRAREKARP